MRQVPLVVDSITQLDATARERVVICGSHCGVYVAEMALAQSLRGLLASDAGIGRARAGIAGLARLEAHGMPAAALDHWTARIGDGGDCASRGRVSAVNEPARALGIEPGQTALEAARLLEGGPPCPPLEVVPKESRRVWRLADGVSLVVVDSAGLIGLGDAGAVAVTGSHGGLLGGQARSAVKAEVAAAIFNDADGGIDQAGYSRLPALDARAIPAATVSAWTARIGVGVSTLEEGIVSRINDSARRRGCKVGLSVPEFVEAVTGRPFELSK